MSVRSIIEIDESRCNGCGDCVTSCAEGAIQVIDGKAKLVKDSYCDGLGACLKECPTGALKVVTREAAAFDEKAVAAHLGRTPHAHGHGHHDHGHHGHAHHEHEHHGHEHHDHGHHGHAHHEHEHHGGTPPAQAHACPGMAMRQFDRKPADAGAPVVAGPAQSELTHWPVQLTLLSPAAPFLRGAELLLTADCVPFALPDFHARFLKGKAVAVACPKLDDADSHIEKLTQVLRNAGLKSLTVVHMEVPCCFGLQEIARRAYAAAGVTVPIFDVTISLDGRVTRGPVPLGA